MFGPAALTNREIAVVAWAVAAFLWFVLLQNGGSSIVAVGRAALHPKIIIPISLFGVWLGIAVWIASSAGAWNPMLVKETLIWVGAGIVLFGKFGRVGDRGFFRRTFLATIALPEMIGFFLGIVSFQLWFELFLVPTIVLLVLITTVAARSPDTKVVESVGKGFLAAAGVALFIATTIQIVLQFDTINWEHEVLAFYLPFWLTAWSIPFVYLLGVYSRYELAFIRVNFATPDAAARRRAKAAMVIGFGTRVGWLDAFVRLRLSELVQASSLANARTVIRDWIQSKGPDP